MFPFVDQYTRKDPSEARDRSHPRIFASRLLLGERLFRDCADSIGARTSPRASTESGSRRRDAPQFRAIQRRGSRKETASRMSPYHLVSQTPLVAGAAGLNAIRYLVITLISPQWSARPDGSGGAQEGEQGLARDVPPRLKRSLFLADERPGKKSPPGTVFKPLPTGELQSVRSGGGLCRPLWVTWLESRSQRQPWRERPRDLTGVPITPAATDCGRSRHAVSAPN